VSPGRRAPEGSPNRRSRGRIWTAALAGFALVVGAPAGIVWAVAGGDEEPFPHPAHARLFPLCTGCHGEMDGVAGDRSGFYPAPDACTGCHNGVREERVAWTAPSSVASNLTFVHRGHEEEIVEHGEDRPSCETCHSPSDGQPGESRGGRMEVERARVDACLSCHAHEAAAHYDDAECVTCHVPLAESGFDLRRIEALPAPATHDEAGFLKRAHGKAAQASAPARCATCHVQDRCTSCHVDGDRAEIAAIPPAPGEMSLPDFPAAYPTPESHRAPAFARDHGREASRETCATCHTRDDCLSCHVGPAPGPVPELPARSGVRAPGVGINRRAPESHRSPFFLENHGEGGAAVESATCGTCHQETFCTGCHDAPGAGEADADRGRGVEAPFGDALPGSRLEGAPRAEREGSASGSAFHPPDYFVRHAADAWGQTTECGNCHSTEVFCRSCHQESGIASGGRAGPGYHDAIPLWTFRHGTAARQGLESCASCHSQRQCLQCHSTVGAFRVSPHGPDFDPQRARDRNAATCFACHLTDPLGGPPR